ncbi:MAG: Bax inhibitor-1 family protein [Polyangiales bacterium]
MPATALLRAYLYLGLGFAWAIATLTLLKNAGRLLPWLMFTDARWGLAAVGAALLFGWPAVRGVVGYRSGLAVLLLLSSLVGTIFAMMSMAIRHATLLQVVGLTVMAFAIASLIGQRTRRDLHKVRRAAVLVRDVVEMVAIGLAASLTGSWVEHGLAVLGVGVAMLVVADDTQSLGDAVVTSPEEDGPRLAVVHATDMFFDCFRLSHLFLALLKPQKRKRPR